MSTTPNTAVVAIPSAAVALDTGKKVIAKAAVKPEVKLAAKPAAKPVVKSIVKPVGVKAIQPALKKPALSKPVVTKSPLAPLAKTPTVKKAVVKKAAVKPAATKALPLAKDKKADKAKKPKLVRDSFTIPKAEYVVLEALKQRATKLTRPAKKSELLRAGIKALASLSDAAFLTALGQVPTIKTGRPTLTR
jgi:hypothetical protein